VGSPRQKIPTAWDFLLRGENGSMFFQQEKRPSSGLENLLLTKSKLLWLTISSIAQKFTRILCVTTKIFLLKSKKEHPLKEVLVL
jgi:hypothetical protein